MKVLFTTFTCWNPDAPKQMLWLSNIQAALVLELLKSEPRTFWNGNELLCLPRIAQCSHCFIEQSACELWCQNFLGAMPLAPKTLIHFAERCSDGVASFLKIVCFSEVRTELYLRVWNFTASKGGLRGKALFYWLWYLIFLKQGSCTGSKSHYEGLSAKMKDLLQIYLL